MAKKTPTLPTQATPATPNKGSQTVATTPTPAKQLTSRKAAYQVDDVPALPYHYMQFDVPDASGAAGDVRIGLSAGYYGQLGSPEALRFTVIVESVPLTDVPAEAKAT